MNLSLKPNNLIVFAALAAGALYFMSQRRATAQGVPARSGVSGNPPSATNGVSQLLGGILGGWLSQPTTPAAQQAAQREAGRRAVRANDPYYGASAMTPAAVDFAMQVDQPINDVGWWSVPATGSENHRQEW